MHPKPVKAFGGLRVPDLPADRRTGSSRAENTCLASPTGTKKKVWEDIGGSENRGPYFGTLNSRKVPYRYRRSSGYEDPHATYYKRRGCGVRFEAFRGFCRL